MSVVDRDLGYRALLANLRRLTQSTRRNQSGVFVGVRADAGTEADGVPLVTVAAANEFGTAHVPERSFLRRTVDEKRGEYLTQLGETLDAAAQAPAGMAAAVLRRGLGRIGLAAVRDVRQTMTTLREPPNAPATVQKKGSDNPLIDSGRLRQSIDYEIREV